MHILCLLDQPHVFKPSDRWIWNYLPHASDHVEFLFSSATDRFQKWGKLLQYYPSYWKFGLQVLRRTQAANYDLVVAWEGKNGFPYATLRHMVGRKRPPLVILSLNFRGMIRHFGSLARFGMRTVDHTTVLTPFEVTHYQKVLSLPAERISFCPLGWYDLPSAIRANLEAPQEKFILASGRSYRDYATLAKAVAGLDLKLVILARKFNLAGIQLPDNVTVMDLLPPREFRKLLSQAFFVIIPLQALPHAAGDSHLIQAMSAGKAVIATRTPSSETYIKAGETGILTSPANVSEMRESIWHLWTNPQETQQMGQKARQTYEEKYTMEKYAQRIHTLLHRVHQQASG